MEMPVKRSLKRVSRQEVGYRARAPDELIARATQAESWS